MRSIESLHTAYKPIGKHNVEGKLVRMCALDTPHVNSTFILVHPFYPEWCGPPTVHASCWCNVYGAIRLRIFKETYVPSVLGKRLIYQSHRLLGDMLCSYVGKSLIPMTFKEFIKSCPQKNRKRYLNALRRYLNEGIQERDFELNLFNKLDKLDGFLKKIKSNKEIKPRAIQGRSYIFNLLFGCYTKKIEKLAYRLFPPSRLRSKSRMIVKGLNIPERSRLFMEKLENFKDPLVISLDASSFDASIKVCHLNGLKNIYMRLYPKDQFLKYLLDKREMNLGEGAGIKYKMRGQRNSGEMDTALGNCLNMCSAAISCMIHLGISKYDIVNDGDDCLIILENKCKNRARLTEPSQICKAIKQLMREMGFDTDPESSHIRSVGVEDVEFCRSRLVWYPGGYRWTRNGKRARSTFGMVLRKMNNKKQLLSHIKGMFTCEYFVSSGVPIIQPMLWHYIKLLGGVKKPKRWKNEDYAWRFLQEFSDFPKSLPGPPTIHPLTRISYEKAFGITVNDQLVEEMLVQRVTVINTSRVFNEVSPSTVEAYVEYLQ